VTACGDAVSIPLTKRQWYQHGFDDGIAHADLTEQLAAMELERQDLAMFVRRFIYGSSGSLQKLKEQANDYLKRKGLQGSILRDTQPQGEGSDDGK